MKEMKQDNNQLRNLIDSAKSLLTEFYKTINYNTEIGPRTNRLIELSNQIANIVKNDNPEIANILVQAIKSINNRQIVPVAPYGQMVEKHFINAFAFGSISSTIRVLDVLYSEGMEKEKRGRKIFISHSSKDKNVVSEFCDRILGLGIGLNSDDIFCTSIEDMNVKNGDDIRKHIKENILSADFSFLLISSNYKNSEICLNEMGAVWANDNNVRYYLLPNTDFKEIGWLCDTRQAEKLIDHTTLDKIYKELTDYYNIEGRFDTWSRQRVIFVNNITNDIAERTNGRSIMISESIDEKILTFLKSNPNQSSHDLATLLGLSIRTASDHLKRLQDSGKIEAVGIAHNTRWKIRP